MLECAKGLGSVEMGGDVAFDPSFTEVEVLDVHTSYEEGREASLSETSSVSGGHNYRYEREQSWHDLDLQKLQRDMGFTYAQSNFLAILQKAFEKLEMSIDDKVLDTWALRMVEAYLSDNRRFHSYGHIIKLCDGATPLQQVAALFHDIAYFQVDGGPPENSGCKLAGVLEEDTSAEGSHTYTVVDNVLDDDIRTATHIVMDLFGVQKNSRLHPGCGLNEFASAIITVHYLNGHVPLKEIAQICALIEATIPFRDNSWPPATHEKVRKANEKYAIGLKDHEVIATTVEACGMSNRDVYDFGEEDVLLFLKGTWDLLIENNPIIRDGDETCSIVDWRVAYQKTNKFLTELDPKLVFNAFHGCPDPVTFGKMVERAGKNIEISRLYTGVKLALASLLESLEVESAVEGGLEVVYKERGYEIGCCLQYSSLCENDKVVFEDEPLDEPSIPCLLRVVRHHDFLCHSSCSSSNIDVYTTSLLPGLLCSENGKDSLQVANDLIDAVKRVIARHGDMRPVGTTEAREIIELFPEKFVQETVESCRGKVKRAETIDK